MFVRRRLVRTLTRLANLIKESDQAARASDLLTVVNQLRKSPEQAARRSLALYEGTSSLDDLVLTFGGRALRKPGREWDKALEFTRLRWNAYELSLAVWHQSKKSSPLDENSEPAQKLVDYGGGNEIWRRNRKYILRYDVGSHVSRWRADEISRNQAEQGVLGPSHFKHLVLGLQRSLSKRGLDPYQGSTMPLSDPS